MVVKHDAFGQVHEYGFKFFVHYLNLFHLQELVLDHEFIVPTGKGHKKAKEVKVGNGAHVLRDDGLGVGCDSGQHGQTVVDPASVKNEASQQNEKDVGQGQDKGVTRGGIVCYGKVQVVKEESWHEREHENGAMEVTEIEGIAPSQDENEHVKKDADKSGDS